MASGLSLPDSIRAFVAVRLSPVVDAAIAEFQSALRSLGADVGWVKPDNFHLTLRFMGGKVPPDIVAAMLEGVRAIAACSAPFDLDACGAGGFPSINRPRVIWIGLRGDELIRLAEEVEAVAVKSGLEPESRRFSPHLTIGRVRSPSRGGPLRRAIAAAVDREFGSSRIESVTLYRSFLSPNGARYEALGKFPLLG